MVFRCFQHRDDRYGAAMGISFAPRKGASNHRHMASMGTVLVTCAYLTIFNVCIQVCIHMLSIYIIIYTNVVYIYNYIYTYKYTNRMYMEMRIRIGNPNQFERRGCEPTQAHSSEYLWIKSTFCICPPFPESANSCIDLGLMENAGFPPRWWSMGKPKFWWSLYYSDFRNHKKNIKKHEKHENYLTTTLAQHFLRLKHRSRRAKPHLGLPRLYVYDIIPIIICIHIFQIMYHKYIINTIKLKKHPVFFIPFMAWFHRLDVNPRWRLVDFPSFLNGVFGGVSRPSNIN